MVSCFFVYLFLFCCQFCHMKSLYIWLKCFSLSAAIVFSLSCFISHTEGERKKRRENQQRANVHCLWKTGRVQKPQRKAFVEWKAEQSSESHCCRRTKTCSGEKSVASTFSCERCRDEVTTGYVLAAWVKRHLGNRSRVWPEGGFISNISPNWTRPRLACKIENVS